MRHDKVCTCWHYATCQAVGIEMTDRQTHTHTQAVHSQEDATVLWNQGVHTEREFTANRPDVIIKYKKKEKTCIQMDVAITADRNFAQKEVEKKLKY